MRSFTLISVAVLAIGAHAQSFLLESLKPAWLYDAGALRDYIRSDDLERYEQVHGDASATDKIFSRALAISDGNVGDALIASAVACLDHRTIYFKLVFADLPIPLSFESDSEFHERYNNLPKKLFYDTPPEGDRDKLQHFFGSAYLEWEFRSHNLATAIGNGLEFLEPALIVEGMNDERDKRANKAGIAFALLLERYPYIQPSAILNLIR